MDNLVIELEPNDIDILEWVLVAITNSVDDGRIEVNPNYHDRLRTFTRGMMEGIYSHRHKDDHKLSSEFERPDEGERFYDSDLMPREGTSTSF